MRNILSVLILALALVLSPPAGANDADKDAQIYALVITDAGRKLAGEAVDYRTGMYSELHNRGFSDSEIREFMRPILEAAGFSEVSIVEYFSLFDPNYHGGEKEHLRERHSMVESLLN